MASNKSRVLPDLAAMQAQMQALIEENERLRSAAPTDGVTAQVSKYISKKTGKAGEALKIMGVIDGSTLYPISLSKKACKALSLAHIQKAIKAYAE